MAAIKTKGKRYQRRIDISRQNRKFQNNQTQFYRNYDQEGEKCKYEKLDFDESECFGGVFGVSQQRIGRIPDWKSLGLDLV